MTFPKRKKLSFKNIPSTKPPYLVPPPDLKGSSVLNSSVVACGSHKTTNILLLGTELCSPQIMLAPYPHSVAVFGDRAFMEVWEVKGGRKGGAMMMGLVFL